MGIDFTAFFDHRLDDVGLWSLPDRLNAEWELPAAIAPWVVEHVRGGSPRWEYVTQGQQPSLHSDFLQYGWMSLDGPHGFHGRVGRHAVEVVHLARWWSFLYEERVRSGLQLACRGIARVLASEHILYLPDTVAPPSGASDLRFDGGTVPEAVDWLRVNVGPARTDFAGLPGLDADDPYGSVWFHEQPAG